EAAVQLPRKTTSFRHWAERLQEHAASEAASRELDYWLSTISVPSALPVDREVGETLNTRGVSDAVSFSLTEEETTRLLRDVPKAYRTQINDVLLTALARAFARWTGERSLFIDLESHGREPVVDGLDL